MDGLKNKELLKAARALFLEFSENKSAAASMTLERSDGRLTFRADDYWVALSVPAADYGLPLSEFSERYLRPATTQLAEYLTPRTTARIQVLREFYETLAVTQ